MAGNLLGLPLTVSQLQFLSVDRPFTSTPQSCTHPTIHSFSLRYPISATHPGPHNAVFHCCSTPATQGHTMRHFTVAPRLPPRATQCGISLLLHACHPPIPARLYARKFNYTFLATGGQEFITERHPSWKKVSCPFKGNEQRLALSGSHGDLLSCCLPHLVTSILLLWMQFNSKCMFQKTL